MQMTKGEICGSYREAKSKREQIKILAELNGVDTKTIRSILIEGGYKIGCKEPNVKPPEDDQKKEFGLKELIKMRGEIGSDVQDSVAIDAVFWRLAVKMFDK